MIAPACVGSFIVAIVAASLLAASDHIVFAYAVLCAGFIVALAGIAKDKGAVM